MPHSDLRRARAAAINLIPTSTGAAKAIGLVLPELAGKLDGISVRAPVPTGLAHRPRRATLAGRRRSTRSTRRSRRLPPTARSRRTSSTRTEPLVSTDINESPASCIFDSKLTMANGTLAKVFGWYDNEWGYSCRLVDLVSKLRVRAGLPRSVEKADVAGRSCSSAPT